MLTASPCLNVKDLLVLLVQVAWPVGAVFVAMLFADLLLNGVVAMLFADLLLNGVDVFVVDCGMRENE